MTAPRTPRQPRAARPPVRAPRRGPRATGGPSAAFRRQHGPTPPDAILARLKRALGRLLGVGVRRDADGDEAPPDTNWRDEAWVAALLAAGLRLTGHARRGVVRALLAAGAAGAAALARIAPVSAPPNWQETVSAELETRARGAAGGRRATVAALWAWLSAAVLRLHAELVGLIARAAGAPRYIWTTMRDARVRPLHRELEGTVQTWADPPLSGLPDFHGHPGEPAGCRCMAFPIL